MTSAASSCRPAGPRGASVAASLRICALLLSVLAVISAAQSTNPTVAQAAAAESTSVTSTSVRLSVLGADDGGEAALTYTWSVNGNGTVTFSANGSNAAKSTVATFAAAGAYTLTATISDGGKKPASSKVDVSVVATATTLAISPTSVALNPNRTRTFTATIKDQFGATLSATPTWTATGGTVTSAGRYTAGATPGAGSVTVSSGSLTQTAAVRINAAPTVATAAAATAVPLRTVNLSVLGADDDGEANLRYTWTCTPSTGVVYSGATQGSNAAKNLTATVPAGGSYAFRVTIRDLQGRTVSSRKTVVMPGNWPLTASAVLATTAEDVAVALAPTAQDPEGAALAWSVRTQPAHGSLVGFNAATGAASYVPAANWSGTDVLSLSVSDGVNSVIVPVSVTVSAQNDAPVAAALALTGAEDAALAGAATASDVDGDSLSWSLASPAAHGVATVSAAGVVGYQPAADWNGTDAFTVTVSDGTVSVPVAVGVTVSAVNDAPVAAPLSLSGAEDAPLAGTSTASDADGDALTWSVSVPAAHGVAAVTAAGAVSYQPATDWSGTDVFTVTVSDGTVSVPVAVDVTVTPVADPADITVEGGAAAEGGSITLTVRRSLVDNADVTVALQAVGALRVGRDIDALPTQLVIPAGATSASAVIQVLDDDLREYAESLSVSAVADAGVVPVGAAAVLAVADDHDPIWQIDDGEPGYAETGTWWTSEVHGGWAATATRWSGDANARATYAFDLDASGWFDVAVWAVRDENSDSQTAVSFTGSRGSWTQRIDQSAGTAGWVRVGTVQMGPGAATVAIAKLGSQAGLIRADAVRLTPAAAPGALTELDRGAQGYREVSGAWWDSTLASPNGGGSRYSLTANASAVWEPVLEAGLYKVSFYQVSDLFSSTRVQVGVDTALGTVNQVINQTAGVSRWVELGTVPVLAGQGRVTITGLSNDGPVRADAVRFEALPLDDVTIPTGSASYREIAGAWWTSGMTLGATANPTRYSNDVAVAAARWYAPPADGTYRVLVYRVVNASNGCVATLGGTDADGTLDLGQLSQKAPAVSGWVEVGLMHLAPNGVWPIEIRSLGGSGTPLRADAVRLIRVPLAGPG